MENEKIHPEQSPKKEGASASTAEGKTGFSPAWLGLYLLIISIVLIILIFMLWPDIKLGKDGNLIYEPTWKFFSWILNINDEARIILLVLLSGALGSYIHAATSFVTFVGNRSLEKSWIWWYILRPFIGSTLALIFYFVIRGGLLSTGTEASGISIYGITGLSGLVGMFSKNAVDKLREVFETLFKSEKGKGDEARLDKAVQSTTVEKVLIPFNKITYLKIPEGKNPKDIPLEDLFKMFEGIVTRVPVLSDKDIVKYMVHQSILYGYIARETVEASNKGILFDIKKITLDDFLNHPGVSELVAKSFTFVKKTSTVADARTAMEAIKNCQDVFITENGLAEENLIGWLTNIDIAKSFQA